LGWGEGGGGGALLGVRGTEEMRGDVERCGRFCRPDLLIAFAACCANS
jgi:hypothetical protein